MNKEQWIAEWWGATTPEQIAEEHSREDVWVYFIKEGGANLVKIGLASRLYERLATLQTGNPRALTVIGLWRGRSLTEAAGAESLLHEAYVDTHVRGEWFDLSDRQVEKIARKYGRDSQRWQGECWPTLPKSQQSLS